MIHPLRFNLIKKKVINKSTLLFLANFMSKKRQEHVSKQIFKVKHSLLYKNLIINVANLSKLKKKHVLVLGFCNFCNKISVETKDSQ